MTDLAARVFDIGFTDTLARQHTSLHRLDPRAKLLTTVAFIGVVVSFDKYAVSALLPFLVFPAFVSAVGGVPFRYIATKMIVVSPFAVLLGIFNPLLDTSPMMQLGGISISAGWISFTSILILFFLTVSASLALVAVTGFQPLLAAADRLGAPRVLVVQLMLFFRYLFVLGKEALRMLRSRSLRSRDVRSKSLRSFGSLVGQLLLRTLNRAERIYLAMRTRGFDGEILLLTPIAFKARDALFFVIWSGLFVAARLVNVSEVLGNALLELVR
jgi:cobalt/nickel transport system permease protein